MGAKVNDRVRTVTSELSDEILRAKLSSDIDMKYYPVPSEDSTGKPIWRICFELAFDSRNRMGLDVNGEVVLGRGHDTPGFVGMFTGLDAEQLGVSRRHAMLRPTESKLYVVDLGSTNGTWINNHSIGVNIPYSVSHGDIVRFGRLETTIKIIKRPDSPTKRRTETDPVETMPSIARAITSQLDVREVLKQAIGMTMSYTPADEISVWLVDEKTGELFLEAGQGVNDEQQNVRLPVNDTLAGKVITTGKALRANRQLDGEQIKLKTGYLVEAILYVPLTLGGVTFGVISAAHREHGHSFSANDEHVMTAIADFTAVAVQNARIYHATEQSLTRRNKVLIAVNHALSYELKNQIKAIIGYAGLLESYSLNIDMIDIIRQITETGNDITHMITQLVEATTPAENLIQLAPCDLLETVTRAVDDLHGTAEAKAIFLDFQLIGEPYSIQGDAAQLYKSVFNLLDNAITYCPRHAEVAVALIFWHNDIIVRVRDTGPGIPEEELRHIFDRYYRGPDASNTHGLGLGLEMVRAVVEAHRGTVMAHSVEGQGSEFIITLPATLRVS